MRIFVTIALFASLSRQGLGTRNEGFLRSRAKALPGKRSEKGQWERECGRVCFDNVEKKGK